MSICIFPLIESGRRGRDRLVVGFTTYLYNQCLSPLTLWVRISIRARCTTLCDKVCQWLTTGRWFSPGPPVSSTNKTDRHDIAKIFWKVALKPNQTKPLVEGECEQGRYYRTTSVVK